MKRPPYGGLCYIGLYDLTQTIILINDNIITNSNLTSVIIMEGFRLDIQFSQ